MTESDWPSYFLAAMKAAGIERAADMSRQTGVSESTVSKWLAGTVQPTVPQLRRISPVLRIPVLALAVAAGHFTPKEAQLKDQPVPPSVALVDPVEREIRSANYPADVEKALLKIREDNRRQVGEAIELLEKAGALKSPKKPRS